LRAFGKRYRIPLTRGLKGEDLDGLVRAHPIDDTWSALEYACHYRDVAAIQRDRLDHALVEDDFDPPSMRGEERVASGHYEGLQPGAVADELESNVEALAAFVEGLSDEQLARTMFYNYPERATRELEWVVKHTVHEGEHHLLDIGRVLRAARGR
jgi:hypothetical protein